MFEFNLFGFFIKSFSEYIVKGLIRLKWKCIIYILFLKIELIFKNFVYSWYNVYFILIY